MGKYGRPSFESEFVIAFQDIKSISIQNFIDGRPANQGGLEAFTVGGMFGSVFTGMPYFKGAFAAALSDYKTNSDVRANLKINKINSKEVFEDLNKNILTYL